MLDVREKTKGMQQVTNCPDDNWDLYADQDGFLWSIAIKEGCGDTTFGSVAYLVSMICKYNIYKMQDFTEYGLNLLKKYVWRGDLKFIFREDK